MTITSELRHTVRERAHYACEYCGVTETDTAGHLTVDHYHPRSRGGDDSADNLIYCCSRCNEYKADYWPTLPGDQALWNPRNESANVHFVELADGTVYGISAVGIFTIKRLRLNRPPLVAYRSRQRYRAEEMRLLVRYQDIITSLERLYSQQAALLEEHHALLEEQRRVLMLLIEKERAL